MSSPDNGSEQAVSCAKQWQETLDWLDFWFAAEKAGAHEFDVGERELFDSLAADWLEAEPGAGKITALEAASDRFGRARVHSLVDKVCADETAGWWSRPEQQGGGTLEDLVNALWKPLESMDGFEFSCEKLANGLQFQVTRCPHAEMGRALKAQEWLFAMVCAGDPHVASAFAGIRFQRTKTLMQGCDCCDHAYFVD